MSTLLLHNNVMGAAARPHDVSVAHADNLDHSVWNMIADITTDFLFFFLVFSAPMCLHMEVVWTL